MSCCMIMSQQATQAVMCELCRKAERDEEGDAVGCTVNGLPIVCIVSRPGACPRGRGPDERGRVRWMGLTWRGVPEPLRWRWWFRIGRDASCGGCGCVISWRWKARRGPMKLVGWMLSWSPRVRAWLAQRRGVATGVPNGPPRPGPLP